MTQMRQEIGDQPQAIARIVEREIATARAIADAVKRRGIRWVVLAARGSSDHAAIYGQYLLQIENGLQVALAAPSVFTRYDAPVSLSDTLVIGVSQSGEAPDVLEVVATARVQGALTVGITNHERSPLASAPEYALFCQAGAELSVAATKTYLTSLAAFLMLAACLDPRTEGLEGSLHDLPSVIERAMGCEPAVRERAERYRYLAECVTLSRGLHLCTAMEAALKLTETCRVVARPFSVADFFHGPLSLAGNGFPCLLFAPPGPCRPDVLGLEKKLRSAGSETVVFDLADLRDAEGTVRIDVPWRSAPEAFAPFAHGVAAQLFACHLSVARGLEPDHPRGLTKVTRTL